MKHSGRLFFSINKPEDWQRGLMINLTPASDGLSIDQMRDKEKIIMGGLFYSCSFDSGEKEFEWFRITSDFVGDENSYVKISYYSSDIKLIEVDGESLSIDSFIRDESLGVAKKREVLDALFENTLTNAKDALLCIRGRYLWIKVELLTLGNQSPKLSRIRIYFKGEEIIDYLPAIYREGLMDRSFFRRFMAIFQSFIFDLEERIYGVSDNFDPESTQGEMLRWLASWVGIDRAYTYDEPKLREMMKSCMEIYSTIGTREGIIRFVKFHVGVTPIIVEYFDVREQVETGKDKAVYESLYGKNIYKFFILLPEKTFRDRNHRNDFLGLLRENIPMHTEVELILLKPSIFLDRHSYLGINSKIGRTEVMSIDENSTMYYDTILGGDIR